MEIFHETSQLGNERILKHVCLISEAWRTRGKRLRKLYRDIIEAVFLIAEKRIHCRKPARAWHEIPHCARTENWSMKLSQLQSEAAEGDCSLHRMFFSFLIPIIFLRKMRLKTPSMRSIQRLESEALNSKSFPLRKQEKQILPTATATSYLIVICLPSLPSKQPPKLGHRTALIRSKTFILLPQKTAPFSGCIMFISQQKSSCLLIFPIDIPPPLSSLLESSANQFLGCAILWGIMHESISTPSPPPPPLLS